MKVGLEDIEERVLSSRTETSRCEIHRFCASLELAGLLVVAVWTCTEVRDAIMRGMHLAVEKFPMRCKSIVKATRAVVTQV